MKLLRHPGHAGLLVASLIFLCIGYLAERDRTSLREALRARAESYETLSVLERIDATIKTIESGQRGYVLSGDERSLAQVEAASKKLEELLHELVVRTSHDPILAGHAGRLGSLARERVRLAQEIIRLRREKGLEQAREAISKDTSRALMGRIRDIMAKTQTFEESRWKAHNDRIQSDFDRVEMLVRLGSTMAILVVILAVVSLVHENRGRRRAEQDLRNLNQQLDQRVKERTAQLLDANELLSRSEQEVRSLALFPEQNPNPVLRIGAGGTLLYVNSSGRKQLDAIPMASEKAPDVLAEMTDRSLSEGKARQLELPQKGRILELLFHPIVANSYVNVYGRDITERMENERQLRKLNRVLRALSNSNQALMRVTDEAALYQELCRIIVDDCGYSMVWIGLAEQDEQKTVRPVAHAGFEEGYLETLGLTWADTPRGRGPTGTCIRTGQSRICRNMLTDPDFEPWRKEALDRGYASSIALPLIVDSRTIGSLAIYSREPDPFSEDEVRLLNELAADLAHGMAKSAAGKAKQAAEEALRETEERVRLALWGAQQGTWDWDLHTNVLVWDQRCREIFGLGPNDPVSYSRHIDLLHPDDRDRIFEAGMRSLRERTPFDEEYRTVRPDGEVRWILSRGQASYDSAGKPTRMLGTVLDITEKNLMEEKLRTTLQEKDLLLKELYHRTKNNMTVISSLINLQSSYVADPATQLMFKETRNRIMAMALVHERLYKSRNLARLDVRDYIQELVSAMISVQRPQIRLDLDIQQTEFDIETAIPCGLVLNELVSNSVKHAFPEKMCGHITIRLRSLNETEQELTYGDNGVGLPTDLHISDSKTLGMRLIHMLITRQLKGTLEVNRNKGTEFVIRFSTGR